MERVFYDKDADLGTLKGTKVGIIGYGIQGRAQALNLRDSGVDVIVGNRSDSYVSTADQDGFHVHEISEVAGLADIVMLLIPDQAHKEVYESHVRSNLHQGGALVVAHGYSLHYKEIVPRADMDVMLLAPRMPGSPIRDYYLRGSGIPAFVDVVQDASGKAWEMNLALAKGLGFTRVGVLQVALAHETELDLFIEQFLVPMIMKSIQVSFDELVNAGYPALPALMELYASGELGEVLIAAAQVGLYRGWQQNASPTCQFGIASGYDDALETDPRTFIHKVIRQIRSGDFVNALREEGNAGYPATNGLWGRMSDTLLSQTHEEMNEIIHLGEAKHGGE